MKKSISVVFLVLSMMVGIVGSAKAAPKTAGVGFLGGVFTDGGVKFKFSVDEKLGNGQLKGTVSWGDGSVQMSCNQEGDTVTCTAPKTVADKDVIVTFGGSQFWTKVKSKPEYCYSVWDFDLAYNWQDYGPHCQNKPAEYGDWILYYNPDWDNTYNVYFWWQEDSGCSTGIVGDAYYYKGCH